MTAGVYEIRFRGEAGPALRVAFEERPDLAVVTERGATVLLGAFSDQAALHSVLDLVESLGLELLDVHLAPDNVTKDP